MPDVTVTIGAKNALLKTGLEEGKAYVRDFAKDVGTQMAGAFAGYQVFESIKALGEKAKATLNQAKVLGSTVEDVQVLGNAAEKTDAKLGDLSTELDRLRKSGQMAAVEGNQVMIDSFARLGVTVDDLKNKDAAKIFYQISDSIKEGKDSANQLVDLANIMGKSAGDMLGLLLLGSAGIKELGHQGVVQTKAELEELKASMETMTRMWDTFITVIGGAFDYLIRGVETVLAKLGQLGSLLVGNTAKAEEFFLAMWRIQHPDNSESTFGAASGSVDPDSIDPEKRAAKAATELKTRAAYLLETQRKMDDLAAEAAQKQLPLALRLYELQQEKLKLEAQWSNAAFTTESELRDLGEQRLQNERDLLATEKQITDEKDKQEKQQEAAGKAAADALTKSIEEGIRLQEESIASKKKEISEDESALRSLHADSLRAIGGTLRGVNYSALGANNPLAEHLAVLKQQLSVQEASLEVQRAYLGGNHLAPSTTPQAAPFGGNTGGVRGNAGSMINVHGFKANGFKANGFKVSGFNVSGFNLR